MGIIGGKEPVENCVVETYTRYLSTNVVFPFIREMITRDANERSEHETKRNEEARRGGGGGKGKETKRKKERSERVTERCFNLHNDRSVPFRACARATRIRIYTRIAGVDANNWRSSILSVGIAHSETSFASAFVHPERESTDIHAHARDFFLSFPSLSLSPSLSLFPYLCFSASKRGGAMRVSIHTR